MIKFFISLAKSVIGCIKNRHQHIILIASADVSTTINQQKVSPFAFALKRKWEIENTTSKIALRTKCEDDASDYDFSLAPLLDFFAKIRLSRTIAWQLNLALLKPKTLVAIDWDIALNKACAAKKIKLYYLQHGVIVADHMYFGKHLLSKLPASDLPYGFLCWDAVSARNFEHSCQAFVIGNQWNNGFLENTFLQLFKKDDAALALSVFIKPMLLFTLTWGGHHSYIIPDYMIGVIKQTLHIYTWIIRLHPVVYMKKENRDEFEQFLDQYFTLEEKGKFFWKEFNTLPLPLILTKAKTHITIESSVVIEAAQFGITSLILNNKMFQYGPDGDNTPPYGGPSYFENERKHGYAQVYNTGLNIKDWISQQKIKEPLINLEKNKREWEKFTSSISTSYNTYDN